MSINEINSRNSHIDIYGCRGLYKALVKFSWFIEMFEYIKCLNASVIKLNACGQNWEFWVRFMD